MTGIEAQIAAEGRAMNRVFVARGVDAMTGPAGVLVGGQSVVLYGLRRRRSVALREIAGLLPDLSAAVSSVRRCRVPVRLADGGAPVLEVPHPDPAPLRLPGGWPAGSGALLGRCYGFGGARDLRVDLAVEPHLLIVAQTGGGKSSLLQLAALSLAWSASPADLRLILIDHKREALLPLCDLPHVDSFSWRPAESAGALAWAADEIERRIADGGRAAPRVVVLIDELRSALSDRGAVACLDQIVSVGRALGVHVIAATQHVDFAGAIRANFTARAVGPVVSANAAVAAAGLPGSGAQYLPGAGAFVFVAGGSVTRFQSYYLGADVAPAVGATVERWRGVVAEGLPVAEGAQAAAAAAGVDPALLAAVAPVWRAGGSQAAMVRAAFGPAANTGGANRTRVLAAVAALEAGADSAIHS